MARMTGARFFAEAIRAYGVSHIFFVPTILTRALAEMEGMGIARVTTHGEKAAAYMADGYARASHRPGVCLAQTIGAANLAAGLRDAYMACSPVIAISGGPHPLNRHRYAYQEIDDFPLFDPLTKFNGRVDAVERLPDMLRQAFRAAASGCPRPVHLEFEGHYGQVIDKEADLELIVEEAYSGFPAFRPGADPSRVREAARSLSRAQRPVIVAGGGVTASRAEAEVLQLAEMLSIPVATSLNGKGTIPENHALSAGVVGAYSRWCANRIVAESDLVFYIGSHTGSQVTNVWKVPRPGTPVIQLDIEPQELGRNYPNLVSLCGDAQASLRQLIAELEPRRNGGDWLKRCQDLVRDWRTEAESWQRSSAAPMRPERICREIQEWLPENAILVSDTGHAGIWTGGHVELRHPGQSYLRAAGSLGWGFPAALGARCAQPGRPVVCFTGDGGIYYHLAELETAARYNIPAVIVVNNNRSLNQETNIFAEAYGGEQHAGFDMWQFKDLNFARIAESLGCFGLRVERPEEIKPALEEALASGRPAVIDAVSDIEALAPPAWG